MFQNPFSFNGRIRRLEYGLTYVIYFIAALVIQYFLTNTPFVAVFFLPVLWFFFAQGAKRCHDLDHSGWYLLIPFYILWMLFEDGNKRTNEYGSSPKYPELAENPITENVDILDSDIVV